MGCLAADPLLVRRFALFLAFAPGMEGRLCFAEAPFAFGRRAGVAFPAPLLERIVAPFGCARRAFALVFSPGADGPDDEERGEDDAGEEYGNRHVFSVPRGGECLQRGAGAVHYRATLGLSLIGFHNGRAYGMQVRLESLK